MAMELHFVPFHPRSSIQYNQMMCYYLPYPAALLMYCL